MEWSSVGKHFDQVWPVAAFFLGVVTTALLDLLRVDREWGHKERTRREQYQREQLHDLQDAVDRYQRSVFLGWSQAESDAVKEAQKPEAERNPYTLLFHGLLAMHYHDGAARNTIQMLRTRMTDAVVRECVDELLAMDLAVYENEQDDPDMLFASKTKNASVELTALVKRLNERIGVILAS